MWVVLCLTALLVFISYRFYTWANPKCNGKLPPGSMGFPIIGETLEFFSPHALYDIPPFIQKRMARYGPLFRTSFVGQKVVVSTDPEINHYIFQQEGKSFLAWYTDSVTEIIGQESILTYHGMVHKYLRNLVLQLVGPEKLKGMLIHELDDSTRKHLHTWARHGMVDVKEVIAEMIFGYFAKKLISYDESRTPRKLRESYNAFIDGLISFPLNIPGTAFHTCLHGRKNSMKVIEEIFEERKKSTTPHHDFLDHFIEEVKREGAIMNEEIALNLVFLLLFASYETTSEATTLAIKFIFDHPQVQAELVKEHEAILRSRDNEESEITWQEYKSMTFTHMVINETVRLANIVPGIFRKAVEDVEVKGKFIVFVTWGYTIPKGWLVMVVPSVLHLNPTTYDDPLAFNPWRWEGKELHVGSKTFMAFGGGVRLCAGADFSNLVMAIFLHYFVTKYRWKVTKGGDIIRKLGLVFPNGLHIEISEK
ncbi:cytochrome P450 87A3-like isoform X1 [Fagus crenata]